MTIFLVIECPQKMQKKTGIQLRHRLSARRPMYWPVCISADLVVNNHSFSGPTSKRVKEIPIYLNVATLVPPQPASKYSVILAQCIPQVQDCCSNFKIFTLRVTLQSSK